MKDDDFSRREPPLREPGTRRAEGFEPIGAVLARLVEKVKGERDGW